MQQNLESIKDRASDLERVYRERTAQIPSDIIEIFLVRDTLGTRVLQIITVGISRESLERMRSSSVKPDGCAYIRGSEDNTDTVDFRCCCPSETHMITEGFMFIFYSYGRSIPYRRFLFFFKLFFVNTSINISFVGTT
ncbi:hypothetical protein [Methanolobus sp.]|uniref:hypothetical protein n=1 Tax=Methanolobus sp. TaxID=1874737 RepID=UPI0025E9C652|nr:hypothetical protein [Methanolobus sp.]